MKTTPQTASTAQTAAQTTRGLAVNTKLRAGYGQCWVFSGFRALYPISSAGDGSI